MVMATFSHCSTLGGCGQSPHLEVRARVGRGHGDLDTANRGGVPGMWEWPEDPEVHVPGRGVVDLDLDKKVCACNHLRAEGYRRPLGRDTVPARCLGLGDGLVLQPGAEGGDLIVHGLGAACSSHRHGGMACGAVEESRGGWHGGVGWMAVRILTASAGCKNGLSDLLGRDTG